ncbi:retrovirus-related pol polyprotein from transposon TNT 1-94 [Tanacetum coccineum]
MSSPNLSYNQSTTSQVIHNHKIYTIKFIHYPIYTTTQDNQDRDLVLRRNKEKSLDYNNSFLGEYGCSSLALDREERRVEKKRLDHLKQDQTMLVIKRFSERKKVFRERKKTEKIHAKRRIPCRIAGVSLWTLPEAYEAESPDSDPFPSYKLKPVQGCRFWEELKKFRDSYIKAKYSKCMKKSFEVMSEVMCKTPIKTGFGVEITFYVILIHFVRLTAEGNKAGGVNTSTEASGSKPRSNTKKNRILPTKSENKKKFEDHPRTNKSVWTKVNQVDSSISSKRVVINLNSESVCKTCNKCLNSANHKMCVVNILCSVNATPTVKIILNKGKQIWKPKGKLSNNSLNKSKRVWKATGKLFADISYQWRPTGKKFTLGKLNCGYQWRPTGKKFSLGELCPLTKLSVVFWYLDSGCSKHMTNNRSKLKNFVEKFIGTVRFGNDHFGAIMGYGYYVIGDSVISRVYYVDGLGHNLFFVGQFCNSDLEIAFRKHSSFVRDMNGVDLLKGGRSTNLYTILIDDMMKSSLVCLLSKAFKTKSWLWYRRLNHLNFGTINVLAQKDLVRGLPRLKFEKDHLCSACQLGKSKKYSHKPKSENTNMEVLHTLYMDLCGPIRDETPVFVINFLKQIQVGLNKIVRYIRIDNGTEFVNQVMSKYYEGVGIFHQKSVLRTPQQNGVVERRNRTLVEAARTMLIFSKASMFLWAVAIATACYTQNWSLIHTRHNKTPYELVHDKKPDLIFLRVFGALCYPTNDSEDLASQDETTGPSVHPEDATSTKMVRETLSHADVEFGDSEPVPTATVVNAPIVSTSIAQDAPSTSHSLSSLQVHPPVFPQGEPSSAQSTSGDVSLAEPNQVTQPPDHLRV